MLNDSTIKNRTIFCHDNLDVLRGINSDCIDLIYLDPPFNKKKEFTAPIGSSAEGASFIDIFKEEDVKEDWLDEIKEDHYTVHDLLCAIRTIEGRTSYNFCYLAYMAIRLMECHRVLKDTGSLYLHCDQTMSHSLKLLLDCIFGEKNFQNEIIWHYTGGGRAKSYFSRKHDSILCYAKSSRAIFNIDAVRQPYKETSGFAKSGITAKSGKKYHPNPLGTPIDDVWDIPIINPLSKERTGYPTQKPLVLLERIIAASCPEGGIVLDPFCGCATTCVAAEKMERRWVGVDVSIKAYELVQKRMDKEVVRKDELFKEEVHFETDPPKRTDIGKDTRLQKFVYVISNEKYEGEYKVGIASDVNARLSSYQTADPNRGYKIEHKLRTPHFREIEKYIHGSEKYENKHEWVRGDLDEIKKDIDTYKK